MERPTIPEDLRVVKTKQLIVDALMNLVAETSWEEVSVAAVCRRARIHRTTFYAHYEDKQDLLVRCLPAFFDGLVGEDPWRAFFDHCSQRKIFYRKALEGGTEFRVLLTDYLCRHALDHGAPAEGRDLGIRFAAGAIVGVVEWFVTTEPTPDVESTVTQLVSLLSRAPREG